MEVVLEEICLSIDVHLKIEILKSTFRIKRAGAHFLTVHVETCAHLHRKVCQIKKQIIKVWVSLNPVTSLVSVEEITQDVDLLLIMSVYPDFGGQSFIPSAIDKIKRAKSMIFNKALRFY